ncbi:ATP-dependent helicase [Streptococcus iniae]|uniref:UvrD-helicase domain-containing protein n=1 Tax=Streptococcus iniae TaxID=1346 RepID=UPI000EF68E82|nr:UvrD-helicase domain-containing protein [Streptococcus iniae]RLU55868.1 ATP-dependent helicase [Streptococcus iniae]
MHDLLEQIENELLPMGCHFSEEQKSVIFENNDMDVVAGPGTGKTTVLTARIKILLEQLKGSGQGICVLTHTNVAVDEIKSSLKKLGVEEIKNPHFIGTIQDFFNTFFAKKAFHLILGDKQMRVLDDDLFQERFNKQFELRKPKNYNDDWSLPNTKKWEINWNFDNLDQVASKVVPNSYNRAFNNSITWLFNQGIVTNKCCLELAKWYIEQRRETLRTIISKRFSYLLLDEAQDTSQLQFSLIRSLFESTSVFIQKFGDPYQAIYNIWGGDTGLAWQVDRSIEKRISKTSRFSESIVEIVKNVCVVNYNDFYSDSNHTSFSPYYIVYSNGDDILNKYSSLIEGLEIENASFKESNKAKMIVSINHKDLESTFGNKYQRPTSEKRKQVNQVKLLTDLIYKEVSRYFDNPIDEYFNNDEIRIQVFNIFMDLKNSNQETVIKNLQKLVDNLISIIDATENEILLNSELDMAEEILQKFLSNYPKDMPEEHNNNVIDIGIGTIHSVKGETHKATLLMMDSTFTIGFKRDSPSYSLLSLLEQYLMKDYRELPAEKNKEEKEIEKALKLAYVALSRPTHLVCIGIPAQLIERDSDFLSNLQKAGWIEFPTINDTTIVNNLMQF